MKQQTAVEWLVEQISYDNGFGQRLASFTETTDLSEYFAQAIEIFEKQIVEAYNQGSFDTCMKEPKNVQGTKYYNETYKK